MARHELHYALLPHVSGWRNAAVPQAAHQFCEVSAHKARKQPVFTAEPMPGLKVNQPPLILLPVDSGDSELPMSVVISGVKLVSDVYSYFSLLCRIISTLIVMLLKLSC